MIHQQTTVGQIASRKNREFVSIENNLVPDYVQDFYAATKSWSPT